LLFITGGIYHNATMKEIVVLDGYAMNPGDLDWSPLFAVGRVTLHDRTPPGQVASRARDAEIVLTNKALLSRATLAQLPKLEYISVLATGYNVVDVDAARERGIPVSNVPAYSTRSVAQHTFALLLEMTNHTGLHSQMVHAGEWCVSPDFSFWRAPLAELDGQVMGIMGFGAIGQCVAQIAMAFGMRVIAFARHRPPGLPQDVMWAESADQLFREADVLSLHCPLTPETREMVNQRTLALMKNTARLINTGRGPLVNEADLAAALNTGRIAGAAMDVLSMEPPARDNPLLSAANCWITPHYAWATQAARQRLMNVTAQNIRAFLDGHPIHVVNGV